MSTPKPAARSISKSDLDRLETHLRRALQGGALSFDVPAHRGASVEVQIAGETVGTIDQVDEDAERYWAVTMVVLEDELPPGEAVGLPCLPADARATCGTLPGRVRPKAPVTERQSPSRLVRLGSRTMADYRIYPLDERGGLTRGEDVSCGNDTEACKLAQQFLKGNQQAEIWIGTRLVGRVVAMIPLHGEGWLMAGGPAFET